MFKMRPSRVLRKLRANEVAYCFKHNLNDPRSVDLAGLFGFDCHWLCMEHSSGDWSAIEAQIYAAKSRNTDTVVRVPRGPYSDYIKPLELDATGIMVPHVMNAREARAVVRMTRFHPLGRRPIDGGNADGGYCNVDLHEYLRQSNEEHFVAVQIEDPEALDELDAICAVEGIDIIFFGPADFSHGIGAPGEFDHPMVREARLRIAEAARAHGKFAGTVASPESARECADMGYLFLAVGADVIGISDYCMKIASRLGLLPDHSKA